MLQNLNQKPEVIDFIKKYIHNPRGFLLLSGTNGTGKTFTAMKIYEAISPYKLPDYDSDCAMFFTQADMNMKFSKDAMNGGAGYFLDRVVSTKLLIIDDLGTRTPSEAFMDFLYTVADSRYNEKNSKGTIITTNMDSRMMQDKFGTAFFSRVASGQCFRFDGKDRRVDAHKTALEPQGCIIPIDSEEYANKHQTTRKVP